MSRVINYNYEKFSLFDIERYLVENGYKVEYLTEDPVYPKLHIVGTEVYVDFPLFDSVNNWIMAEIRFKDYPVKDSYETSRQLYQKLGRKFGVKKGEQANRIKDRELLDALRKKGA